MSYHYGSNNNQSNNSTNRSTNRATNVSIKNTGIDSNSNFATGSNSKNKVLILDNDNCDVIIKLIFETLALKRGKKSENVLKDGLTFEKLYDELKHTLMMSKQIVEETAGEDRKNFGSCKCTHPPSLGFCIEGLCVKGNFNFNSLEGSLTITIPF